MFSNAAPSEALIPKRWVGSLRALEYCIFIAYEEEFSTVIGLNKKDVTDNCNGHYFQQQQPKKACQIKTMDTGFWFTKEINRSASDSTQWLIRTMNMPFTCSQIELGHVDRATSSRIICVSTCMLAFCCPCQLQEMLLPPSLPAALNCREAALPSRESRWALWWIHSL